ncbi:MAG: acetylornithine deacetylase [Thermomicrobiales bacterium]|nr:acetylornithine deacetylase [Thermomicrobiales bacterium]
MAQTPRESISRLVGKSASDGSSPLDFSTSPLLDSISSAATRHHESTVALLQELVRVPSVNPYFTDTQEPSREGDVQGILAGRLERLGAQVDQWEPDSVELARYAGGPGYYADRDFRGRPNLVATLPGSGGGQSLLLLGHVDVVSAGEGWTVDPFAAARHSGVIYGRGTADMKAGLAAAVAALEILQAAGVRLRGDVILASVVRSSRSRPICTLLPSAAASSGAD